MQSQPGVRSHWTLDKTACPPTKQHVPQFGLLFVLKVVKMRCQAVVLFVLLAATCCFAADHLLRQQHEQELLRAKVRIAQSVSVVVCMRSDAGWQGLNPLCFDYRPIQSRPLQNGC
jgi:hypothetical protein